MPVEMKKIMAVFFTVIALWFSCHSRDLKIRRRRMSTTASGSWKYLPAHFR